MLWVFRLNKALATYDPLFIIPLLQSQYIVCATLSGGIYFQEFLKLDALHVTFFVLGILIMLSGLILLMPNGSGSRGASEQRTELTEITAMTERASEMDQTMNALFLSTLSERVQESCVLSAVLYSKP